MIMNYLKNTEAHSFNSSACEIKDAFTSPRICFSGLFVEKNIKYVQYSMYLSA